LIAYYVTATAPRYPAQGQRGAPAEEGSFARVERGGGALG
jgi:hypothetical protein